MRQLLYVSSTSRDLAPATLNDILAAARANNPLLGITGLLIHIDGGFLQILEGEERAVRELYMRQPPLGIAPSAGPRSEKPRPHRLEHGV